MFEIEVKHIRSNKIYTASMGRRDKLDQETLVQAGQRLFRQRDDRNLTLEEVAAAVGITPQALSSAENGKTQNRSDVLLKLCAYYDLDPYKVLFGKQKSEIATEVRSRRTRSS